MAIPLTYPHNTKGSFRYPRTSPTIPRYDPPRFEKYDRWSSIGGHHSLSWISDNVRNHAVAILGEFLGTMMFLFFGLAAGQIANGKPDTINRTGSQSAPSLLQLIFISSGFGVGLAVNVWIFFRVSGGMFNPAVSHSLYHNWRELINSGYHSIMSCWSSAMDSRCSSHTSPDRSWHCSRGYSQRSLARRYKCCNYSWSRYNNMARSTD